MDLISLHALRSNPNDDANYRSSVQTLLFSGDGKYIISGTMEGTVVFWNLKRRVRSIMIVLEY